MADPKLDIARLSNESVGGDVVIGHNELEGSLSKILGIPLGQEVNTSLTGGVNADGTLTMFRFKSTEVAASPRVSIGFEFTDGTVVKRLVFVDSKIQIWSADDITDLENTTWTLVYDYEDVDEPDLEDFSDVHILFKVDGQVIGFNEMANGDMKFVVTTNEVGVDGMQNFDDAADIVADGWGVVGSFIGIKSTTKLQPVDPGTVESGVFCGRTGVMAIGRVGILGGDGQDWTVMPFSNITPGSTIVSLDSFEGYAGAGITLAPGLWKASLVYKIVTGVIDGFISWKVVGSQEFPQGKIARQHNEYMRYDGLPWAKDYRKPPYPSGGWGQQDQWLVVPNTTTVGLKMGRESAENCSVVAFLTIARII